jgi:hypothetical protein
MILLTLLFVDFLWAPDECDRRFTLCQQDRRMLFSSSKTPHRGSMRWDCWLMGLRAVPCDPSSVKGGHPNSEARPGPLRPAACLATRIPRPVTYRSVPCDPSSVKGGPHVELVLPAVPTWLYAHTPHGVGVHDRPCRSRCLARSHCLACLHSHSAPEAYAVSRAGNHPASQTCAGNHPVT